jgi:hypothetical protein
MKYNFSRKINLANIDKDLWPYETEDVSATDADSFDEAKNAVEKFVAERTGYYRAQSESHKTIKHSVAKPMPAPPDSTSVPYPGPAGISNIPRTSVEPILPSAGSKPPKEFNI